MDIREVVSFYHTARLRSVSQAAAYLKLGQPTVTTHLQRLEKEFGVQLFDRIKRPIRLTSDGATFFELATPIVQAVEQGLDMMKAQMENPDARGSFSIGAYPDLALKYLPPIIKKYRESYPDVQIKLMSRAYMVLLEMVNAGEVDLAVLHLPPEGHRGLNCQSLFESPLLLIALPGHPLLAQPQPSLSEIAQWPLIMLGPRSFTRRYTEQALKNAELEYNITMEVENVEIIKRYVEIGMGVAIVQKFDLDAKDADRFGSAPLDHIFKPVPVGVATLQGKFLPRSAANFIAMLLLAAGRVEPPAEDRGDAAAAG